MWVFSAAVLCIIANLKFGAMHNEFVWLRIHWNFCRISNNLRCITFSKKLRLQESLHCNSNNASIRGSNDIPTAAINGSTMNTSSIDHHINTNNGNLNVNLSFHSYSTPSKQIQTSLANWVTTSDQRYKKVLL